MLNVQMAAIEDAIRGCVVIATYSLKTTQLSPSTGHVEGKKLVFGTPAVVRPGSMCYTSKQAAVFPGAGCENP